jgi:hypothetical protein
MWSVTTCSLVQVCQHPVGTCWTEGYRTTRHRFLENSGLNFVGTSLRTSYFSVAVIRLIRKIEKIYYSLHHVCLSAWNKLAPIGRIFVKFYI